MGLIFGLHPSPLRYPGGKGKIANYLKLLIATNGLTGCRYVEPYAGGASVALSVLYEDFATEIHINDINASVYSFWYSVLNHTQELCDLIVSATLTVDEWDRQKEIQSVAACGSVELAFSTFYLNRTSRSGILGGGLIGGRDQKGAWKLGARFNKADLVRRIEKISRFKSRIELSRTDAAELLADYTEKPVEHAFFYIDPPYYQKGEDLYQNFYRHNDHEMVADLVKRLSCPWVVSYDAAPEIAAMYKDLRVLEYGLNYSVQRRYTGSEYIFFSDDIRPPEDARPTAVKAPDVDRAKMQIAGLDQ